MALPTSGAAWTALLSAANASIGTPNVSNQDNAANVRVLARALVVARTGDAAKRAEVVTALVAVQGSSVDRALALGRELGAYVLAADLIGYRDPAFVSWVSRMRTVATSGGPSSLVNCSEVRPNNWGTWCLASRIAAERYLGLDLTRSVSVFRGWLGDRSQYAGFSYGDTSWQCNASQPVGINPDCVKQGLDIGGVLPDDQRRGGSFTTNPGCENYVNEALQGVTLSGALLAEAGYPAWTWSDAAIRRAFAWLDDNGCDHSGDDAGNPWVVNHYTGSSFPTGPAGAGKGWLGQDWLYQ